MATLRALLEIYGSLDTALIESDDPRLARAVDRLFPGSSENVGWYEELEAFMFPVGDGTPSDLESAVSTRARTAADPIRALNELNDARTREDRPPTIPELSRIVYGIGALIRVTSAVAETPIPRVDDDTNSSLLSDVLALAGPDSSFGNNRDVVAGQLSEIVNVFADQLTSRGEWPEVAQRLYAMKVLSADVAGVPLCQASVVKIGGIDSVVVDTHFDSDKVSLNQMIGVVDPRNWHRNYPSFFCSMVGKGPRPDGWRKVLETVGFCYVDPPYGRRLVTMLKFHKSKTIEDGKYVARLDYDLNDPTPDPEGDGQIDVDRGFINVYAKDADPALKGVVVRTRKVAHINGIRPYTQKRFVCIFGYGDSTQEMLLGSALDPEYKGEGFPWDDAVVDPDTATSNGPATQPAPPTNSVMSTAFKMAADCVQDLTVKNLDLADKWMAGQLTPADLAEYSTQIGARLASDPWKFLEAISKPKGGGQ
ncbi:hypothetical protein CIW52_33210 [Mycolicibacterium sp. P9-64]|uniref:hypothetical protein n=1 Tax=Mycolicibacterium sp. P9-64 TaxID=2024612 RepID=UPI0011EF85B7|nr:hypothetical protein [Mycolicibacterium sp. P9-64]KAA0075640.1 hypothetical protein CIW52_33210 [Mycolicibacterium sp. P9-64]